MRAMIAGAVVVMVMASAGTAMGQAAPDAAKPERAPFRQIGIQNYAAEGTRWPAPPPDMIRRAATKGDPSEWLREADAPIAAWLKTEETGSATLELSVGADGRATACSSAPAAWQKSLAWAADLCPLLIKRAQFTPALREDGRALPDLFIVTANFQFARNWPGRTGPLIVNYGGLSPAPPPPRTNNPQLTSWPPSEDWLRWVASEPAFKLPVEQPGGAPLAGPAIGLVVADRKSGDPACRVVLSSGDAGIDAKACDFARKKLKPVWADQVRVPVRRWPLLLSPQGKGFRAITAKADAINWLRVEPVELGRLSTLWRPQAVGAKPVRLAGALGPDGRPTGCRVFESSGSDLADTAACRLFRSEARFSPASDAFGQPGKFTGWVNLRLTPP
ncbi:MAG: energy transducer TonB [Sphingomonadaceae bacterium]|nr:energy transducer TonB [Sphingomonadaceae bacterium]